MRKWINIVEQESVEQPLIRMGEKNKKFQNFFLVGKGVDGFGTLRFDKGYATIAFIEIDDALRGKGLGRTYVAAIEQLAKDNGLSVVKGEALQGSESFWELMGYTLLKRSGRDQINKVLDQ